MTQEQVSLPPGLIVDPVLRLKRDLREAAATLSDQEARFLVDYYYIKQDDRKRDKNQVRALGESVEPHSLIAWFADQDRRLENTVKSALDRYSDAKPVGQWAKSITGIGPVLAAGLLAHIDIEQAPTVGHIWRFAGLDPTDKWDKGEKRPWNAKLKTLCWKIGQSFMKVSSLDADVYGKVYQARKTFEWERNLAGGLTDQAAVGAAKVGKGTAAYKWYAGRVTAEAGRAYLVGLKAKPAPAPEPVGPTEPTDNELDPDEAPAHKLPLVEVGQGLAMLPPGHIDARARRYAVKLFLSAYHEVAWFTRYGELPVKPYVLTHLGHVHYFEVPSLDKVPGLRAAKGL